MKERGVRVVREGVNVGRDKEGMKVVRERERKERVRRETRWRVG